jgi:hypothetical protein
MRTKQFFSTIAVLILLALGTAQPASAGQQPDLTVVQTGSAFRNGQWQMWYIVRNIGTANAGRFRITIKNRAGTVMQSFETASLGPGVSRTFWHPTGVCEFYRRIQVDSGHVITESNEANNVRAFENLC